MNAYHTSRFVLLLVLLLGAVLLSFSSPASAQEAPALADPIVLESPTTLIPPFTTPCESYWYRYTNDRSQYAYLTLNVKDPYKSYNRAEWQTAIPELAVYRIEAYIPEHEPLLWDCETDYQTLGDTLTARYEIDTGASTYTMTVNQAANAGQWVVLGEYLLTTEFDVEIRLADLTTETNYTRTVSASAMRFTYIAPGFRAINPLNLDNSYGKAGIYMQTVHVQDDYGNVLARADMEQPVLLAMSGYNDAAQILSANASWNLEGPCEGVDFSLADVRLAEPGDWLETQRLAAPPCTGVYTMTLALAREERSFALQQPLKLDPGTRMGIMQQQGFDKCEITTVENMQAWWNESPYFAVNLYIGGLNRACSNLLLTRDWVKDVQAQGWTFIPTWVGRQAPCMSRDVDKFSIDPDVAYLEGMAEAAEAAAEASKLGLFEARTQSSVVYLDIEGYRYSPTYTPACRTATSSFVAGWVDGMHAAGLQAGVYGGVCSSYMADWAALPTPPDAVWGAAWNLEPVYNPEETVWGWSCVSDTMWSDQQRISQYAGDHPETWGEVTLGGIDSNAIDTILPAPRQLPQPVPSSVPSAASSVEVAQLGTALLDFLPRAAGQGWILAAGKLYETQDGGQTWRAQELNALESVLEAESPGALPLAGAHGPVLVGENATGGPTWRLVAQAGETQRPAYADLATLKGVDLAAGAALPAGASALRAAPDGVLWVYAARGACSGEKGSPDFACSLSHTLWESRDAGRRWTAIELP